jgi:hypothetical protein
MRDRYRNDRRVAEQRSQLRDGNGQLGVGLGGGGQVFAASSGSSLITAAMRGSGRRVRE